MSVNGGPRLVVLGGGASPEAAVSQVSARAVFEALRSQAGVEAVLVELTTDEVPWGALGSPESTVVVPVLHGGFGEDGTLQRQLTAAGFHFMGSAAAASARCMDKPTAKLVAAQHGFRVARQWLSTAGLKQPLASGAAGAKMDLAGEVAVAIADAVELPAILKPSRGGSSLGLVVARTAEELLTGVGRMLGEAEGAPELTGGVPSGGEAVPWMAEELVSGREVTVGWLSGQLLPEVEVCPLGGTYDYARKYQAGQTTYYCPADFPQPVLTRLREAAQATFDALEVRDVARLDAIIDGGGQPWFLEVNTLPGMTPTSLLPKAAAAIGWSFPELIRHLVEPALGRWAAEFRPAGPR